ncbi:MAG: hypothetical protein Kow0098_00720 [Ignavibacteriaceae bacterium]
MDIPIIDKSNYLRGLLITARKDKQLSESEKKILKVFAEKLGFAEDFYEETIRNLLANKYLPEDPVKFSDKQIAESFITDGLKLAYSDERITDNELDWLRETAKTNGLDNSWFEKTREAVQNYYNNPNGDSDLKLYSII